MPMPYYVSPEQLMKDKADYARKGIARGRVGHRSRVHRRDPVHRREPVGDAAQDLRDLRPHRVRRGRQVQRVRAAAHRRHPLGRRQGLLVLPRGRHREGSGQRLLADPRQHLHVRGQALRVRDPGRVGGRHDRDQRAVPHPLRRIRHRPAGLGRDGGPGRGPRTRTSRSKYPKAYPTRPRPEDRAEAGPRRAQDRRGDASLRPSNLEVAVLDRNRGRRKFRRLPDEEITEAPLEALRRLSRSTARILKPMERRIFGTENEYGVTCTFRGQRRLSPDEVARYLFRRVVSWGRSSNVFLENGARLYLDVGSHPEYATPECDTRLRPRRPRQGGGADPRRSPEGGRGAPPRGGDLRRHLPLQEQHRLGRQLLREPRELPRLSLRRVRPPGRGDDPVLRDAPDLRGRGQGAADRPRSAVLHLAARRAHLGGRLLARRPGRGRSSTHATSRTPMRRSTDVST